MTRTQFVRFVARCGISLRTGLSLTSCLTALCASLAVALMGSAATAAPLPQSNLLTWLKADAGVTTSGTEVTSWADQATTVGGANNALRITAGQAPQLATGIAGKPVLRFDGTNDYLRIAASSAFDSQQFTWFMVAQADTVTPATPGLMLRSRYTSGAGGSGGSERLWGTFISASAYTSHSRVSTNVFVGSNNTATTSPALISANWAADDSVTQWLNGTQGAVGTGATATPTGHVNSFIGSDSQTLSNFYDGDISEIIVYNTSILQADRRLVENYLAAKYSGTVGSNALPLSNELYAGDDVTKSNYDLDVFGIGREADGTVTSRSDDLGLTLSQNLSGPNALDIGEYALAGHKLTSNSIVTTDLPGVGSRWERSWYVDATGSFDGKLTFDFSDAGLAFDSNLTQLLFRTTDSGNFSVLSSAGIVSGDQVSFNLLLNNSLDGYFTLGNVLAAPEPSSLAMLSLALVGMACRKNRKKG